MFINSSTEEIRARMLRDYLKECRKQEHREPGFRNKFAVQTKWILNRLRVWFTKIKSK